MNKSTLGIAAVALIVGIIIGWGAVKLFGPEDIQYGITIRPRQGAHPRFENKWAKIKNILDKNEHLYYIEEYVNGQQANVFGNVSKLNLLPLANLETLHQNLPSNYTGHAVQIGIGVSAAEPGANVCLDETTCLDTEPTSHPNMPQGHYKQYMADSAAMVQAVNDCMNHNQCGP